VDLRIYKKYLISCFEKSLYDKQIANIRILVLGVTRGQEILNEALRQLYLIVVGNLHKQTGGYLRDN